MGKRLLSYRDILDNALSCISQANIDRMVKLVQEANLVMVLGNGGSMATAIHFAGDLTKNAGIPAITCDNWTSFTAWANDDGYEKAMAEWVKTFSVPGAVLVAISTSGNSQNVINASMVAKHNQVPVVGLVSFEGGKLATVADLVIHVPTDCIEAAEDAHMAICHEVVWQIKQITG